MDFINMKRSWIYYCLIAVLFFVKPSEAGLWEWVIYGSNYKSEADVPKQVEDHSMGSSLGKLVNVPFEMRTADEKFLVEAAKFGGLKASDLDLCHHKVIMHIKKTCGALTEDDIGKLSVQLLNCQSSVEGRKTYKCTDEMSIGQCTKEMDANTWNAYHIISNRARAVCYAARQQQFTAKTEMTVNKLMWTSENQIAALEKLEDGQNKVTQMTAQTLNTMVTGQKELAERQERLKASQHHIQTFVNGNLRELTREKALIAAGQRELAAMTEAIQRKLDEASKQLQLNEEDRRINHHEILQDLALVQSKTKEMWIKIDNSTQNILSQHMETLSHYQETLKNLQRINSTVNYLLHLVDKTREEVDAKLGWLTGILGDAGDRISIIYCCLIHGVYFIVSAVTASFLHFPMCSRVAILIMVPLNALSDMKQQPCLDFISLTLFLIATILINWFINSAKNIVGSPPPFLSICYKISNSFKLYSNRASLRINNTAAQFKQQCMNRRSSLGGFLNGRASFGNPNEHSHQPELVPNGNFKTSNLGVVHEADLSNISESPNLNDSILTSPGTSTPTSGGAIHRFFEASNAKKDLTRDFDLAPNHLPDRSRESTPTRDSSSTRQRRTSISSSIGKRVCFGTNKSGTPCKMTASSGQEFCYRHQQ